MAQRIIVGGAEWDRPQGTVRSVPDQHIIDSLILSVGRPALGYRVELCWLAVLGGLWGLLYWPLRGPVGPSVAVLAVVGSVAALRRPRRAVWAVLRRRDMRRRWDSACRYAGVVSPNDAVPPVRRLTATRSGWQFETMMPPGLAFSALGDNVELLAQHIGCMEDIEFHRDRIRANVATIRIHKRDPLAEPGALLWPQLR